MALRVLDWVDVDNRPTDGPPGKLRVDGTVVGHVWRSSWTSERSWLWVAGGPLGIPFAGCGVEPLDVLEAREQCVRHVLHSLPGEVAGGVFPPPQGEQDTHGSESD